MIKAYLESKKNSWSETTLRSEASRLSAVGHLLNGNPQILLDHLATQKPYTRLTTWTRVTAYWAWLVQEGLEPGPNPYEKFRRDNARLFKNSYQRKDVPLTYEQAKEAIGKIEDEAIRCRALQILYTGLRVSEATQPIDKENSVIVGKGSKLRPVYGPKVEGKNYEGSYSTFRRALKQVGLRPHDLRKLFATKLVEAGFREADLLKIMGWSSIMTAQYYLQPKKDEDIREVLAKVL